MGGGGGGARLRHDAASASAAAGWWHAAATRAARLFLRLFLLLHTSRQPSAGACSIAPSLRCHLTFILSPPQSLWGQSLTLMRLSVTICYARPPNAGEQFIRFETTTSSKSTCPRHGVPSHSRRRSTRGQARGDALRAQDTALGLTAAVCWLDAVRAVLGAPVLPPGTCVSSP